MVDMSSFLQMGAVFFGTVIAAPLISSDSEKARFFGFSAMFLGNSFALALHVDLSLWVMSAASLFWGVMSVRGIWRTSKAVKKSLPQPLVSPAIDIVPGE